ncbi:MAG TPA: MFS transporter [Microvirga sp.]|jgi:predicted MFS family arabinose efflux permease
MPPFRRLFLSVAGAQFAEQLALAAVPLTAVLVLGAGPGLVGGLVALQGAAWLLVSLPAGVAMDRARRSRLVAGAQALSAAALMLAPLAALKGWWLPFGLCLFLGSAGAVVTGLGAMALLPGIVDRTALPRANARLELARAGATLAAPALAGWLAGRGAPVLGFWLAAGAALLAASVVRGLDDRAPAASGARPPVLQAVREGAAFALRHDLLRGIVLCAVFWNFAYFALAAVLVPYALQRIGLDPALTGLAQSGNGIGLLLGASLAGAILRRAEPRAVMIAGPALSVLAALLLLAAPRFGGLAAAALAMGLLGFGPMLWLICQTTIRQLVTPADLLGRVPALVQVAIYGVRPVGALAGGAVGSAFGLDAALLLVVASFAVSALVPLLSALGRLRTLPVATSEAA